MSTHQNTPTGGALLEGPRPSACELWLVRLRTAVDQWAAEAASSTSAATNSESSIGSTGSRARKL